MGTPHYQRGRWWSKDEWLEAAWKDGEGIAHDGTGLESVTHLGYGDSGLSLTLYGHAPHILNPDIATPPYVIEISGSTIEYVSAETLPDALDLMGRWAPVITAAILTEILAELGELAPRGLVLDTLAALEVSRPRVGRRVAEQERHEAAMRERRQAEAAAREKP